VTLHAGATVAEPELLGFCRERLASFKRPRAIAVWEALPMNAHGKVLKEEVRRRLLGGAGDVGA
jgi:acyl-CoA synthetase (AMP-forming)/AMP-acid ligase II